MPKVLKITDERGIIHIVPVVNKAFYQSYNKRQKPENRWAIEEISEDEASGLPLKDPNFVKPGDALKVIANKDAELADKDNEIAELKALLAASKTKKDVDPVIEKTVSEDAEPEVEETDAPPPVIPALTRAEKQKIARQKAKAAKA